MELFAFVDPETITRIADYCPRAMTTYMICLNKSNFVEGCTFTRDEIVNDRVRSWVKFKNDIRSLSRLFLLTFEDKVDEIDVILIPQE